MKAWHVQLLWCCLCGLSACGKHSALDAADAATPNAATLDGDNGGQVRVGDDTRSRSSPSTGMAEADAAVSSSEAGVGGASGRPGFPMGPRAAGSGAGGRAAFAGRPAFPGTGGMGGFASRPRRDGDPSGDDAGTIETPDEPLPAADGGMVDGGMVDGGVVDAAVMTEPEQGGAAGEGGEGEAGEGGAGSPAEAGSGGAGEPARNVMSLAFCDLEAKRQTKRIDHEMNLRRQSSSRAAYALRGRPRFHPRRAGALG